jgi:hypothetical protein
MPFSILYTASVYSGSLSYYVSHISAQDISLSIRFQSEYLGFYHYLVIPKVVMCQFSTSNKSFQNHHYLAGTRITVKLAVQAGPSGQLFELAIISQNQYLTYSIYNIINISQLCSYTALNFIYHENNKNILGNIIVSLINILVYFLQY